MHRQCPLCPGSHTAAPRPEVPQGLTASSSSVRQRSTWPSAPRPTQCLGLAVTPPPPPTAALHGPTATLFTPTSRARDTYATCRDRRCAAAATVFPPPLPPPVPRGTPRPPPRGPSPARRRWRSTASGPGPREAPGRPPRPSARSAGSVLLRPRCFLDVVLGARLACALGAGPRGLAWAVSLGCGAGEAWAWAGPGGLRDPGSVGALGAARYGSEGRGAVRVSGSAEPVPANTNSGGERNGQQPMKGGSPCTICNTPAPSTLQPPGPPPLPLPLPPPSCGKQVLVAVAGGGGGGALLHRRRAQRNSPRKRWIIRAISPLRKSQGSKGKGAADPWLPQPLTTSWQRVCTADPNKKLLHHSSPHPESGKGNAMV